MATDKKLKNHTVDQAGFSILEVAAIVITLSVIGLICVYTLHARLNKDNPKLTVLNITKANFNSVTAGWKSYTLPNEGAVFKYPSSWKLIDYYYKGANYGDGSDNVMLDGPGGFNVVLANGLNSGISSCAGPAVISAEKLTFAGQVGYLDLLTDNTAACVYEPHYGNKVSSIELSTSATYDNQFNSKDKKLISHTSGIPEQKYIDITAGYGIYDTISTDSDTEVTEGSGTPSVAQSILQVENDPNYRNVGYIAESFTYIKN